MPETKQILSKEAILARIERFKSRHHKFEANKLTEALATIEGLVPPNELYASPEAVDDKLTIEDWSKMCDRLQDTIRDLKEENDKLKEANQSILDAHYRNHPNME